MDGQKTTSRTTTLEVLMWRIKTTQERIENDKKYLKELETAYDAVLNPIVATTKTTEEWQKEQRDYERAERRAVERVGLNKKVA